MGSVKITTCRILITLIHVAIICHKHELKLIISTRMTQGDKALEEKGGKHEGRD